MQCRLFITTWWNDQSRRCVAACGIWFCKQSCLACGLEWVTGAEMSLQSGGPSPWPAPQDMSHPILLKCVVQMSFLLHAMMWERWVSDLCLSPILSTMSPPHHCSEKRYSFLGLGIYSSCGKGLIHWTRLFTRSIVALKSQGGMDLADPRCQGLYGHL